MKRSRLITAKQSTLQKYRKLSQWLQHVSSPSADPSRVKVTGLDSWVIATKHGIIDWFHRNPNWRWPLTARNTTELYIHNHWSPYGAPATLQLRLQQSYSNKLASFASLLAISGTFNPLSKVLFTFPSRYLFAIGLRSIFSFRWKLPPV